MTSFVAPTRSSSRLPKWKEVLREITANFDAGKYEAGQPFLTLGALSRQYGVSDITARRVFRELKSQGRILTRGSRGTFIAPLHERQAVFMCLPPAQLAWPMGDLADGSAFFQRFLTLFHQERLDKRFEIKPIAVDFCLRNPDAVAGFPLFVSMEAILKTEGERVLVDQERLDSLRRCGHLIVFRSLPGIVDGVDQVSKNPYDGIRDAVRHLVDQGHSHLAMLCGRLTSVWFKPRFEGFLDALSEAGLSCDPRLVEITTGLDQQEDFAAVERLLAREPRPTAIVCANDSRALHVLDYCRARGVAVPKDLAVTGFDNTLEASLSSPPLTSVDSCDEDLVRAMFQMVERKISGARGKPEQVVVSPRLIPRQSS